MTELVTCSEVVKTSSFSVFKAGHGERRSQDLLSRNSELLLKCVGRGLGEGEEYTVVG